MTVSTCVLSSKAALMRYFPETHTKVSLIRLNFTSARAILGLIHLNFLSAKARPILRRIEVQFLLVFSVLIFIAVPPLFHAR
jgi:hypothetical protein